MTVPGEDVPGFFSGTTETTGLERIGSRGWRRFGGGFGGRKGVGQESGDRVREVEMGDDGGDWCEFE